MPILPSLGSVHLCIVCVYIVHMWPVCIQDIATLAFASLIAFEDTFLDERITCHFDLATMKLDCSII